MLSPDNTRATHGAPQMNFNRSGDDIEVWSVTSGTEVKLLYIGYSAASDSGNV